MSYFIFSLLVWCMLIQNNHSSSLVSKKTKYHTREDAETIFWRSEEDKKYCTGKGEEIRVKKRIVLDLGTSGMGNRMMATSSAAIMAVIMDRTLVLHWKVSSSSTESKEMLECA